MKKKVILNCVTPFATNLPSPALSILKSWLAKHQVSSSIIYWNLLLANLHNDFVWNNPKVLGNSHNLALAVNYFANKNKDKIYNESLKKLLQGASPRFISDNLEYYESHMTRFAEEMDRIIDNILSQINFSEVLCFGFSMKMDGWAVSSIIAKKIKKIDPTIPIIIGGVSTKKDAKAFLLSFKQFDIAMWGEGEYPLIQIVNTLRDNTNDLSKVCNIAYKDSDTNIIFSKEVNKSFVDLSMKNLYPNYDDYFKQKKELNIKQDTILPIEGSRGCHWNRCKFCYLNTDYKYRLKSPDKICEEIRYMIKKHEIYSFQFLDNDFLGLDIKVANELLDCLIVLKEEEPKFKILLVEVITKKLDYNTIKKIFKAGISYVQIGYESTSNNLLKKINKKNTFASNLFYIKVSTKYGIPMYSVNNIMNMPDETIEDIIEATNNLRYLRFFLHHLNFNHTLIHLHVNSYSRYYHRIKKEIDSWELSEIAYYFLKEEIKEEYWWDVFAFTKRTEHFQWESFRNIEKFYINNQHSYTVTKVDSIFRYSEFINKRKIIELNFDEKSISFQILFNTNKRILSLSDLIDILRNQSNYFTITQEEILDNIETLYSQGLVYKTPDNEEIISVINITDTVS